MLKRIKSVLLLTLTVIIIPFIFIQASLAENTGLVSLSDKTLLATLRKAVGNDWSFYQPASRESSVDCSSKAFLNVVDVFPVVAQKDSQYKLIILEKEKGTWKYKVENPDALMRDGFSLRSFSIDENINSDDICINTYFDFDISESESATLVLVLRSGYAYFDCLSISKPGFSDTQKSILFNWTA